MTFTGSVLPTKISPYRYLAESEVPSWLLRSALSMRNRCLTRSSLACADQDQNADQRFGSRAG